MLRFKTMPSGEEFIKRYVDYYLLSKKNLVIGIVGKSGQGKSYTALRLGMIIDKKFTPETHIIYHAYLLNQKIQEALENHYKVLILDEAHVTLPARSWHEFVQRSIDTVLNTFRALGNIVFIVVTPNFAKIDKSMREMFDLYAVTWRYINTKPYIDLFEVYFPYYDLIRPFPKLKKIRIRVKMQDGDYKTLTVKKIKIGCIDKDMIERYEKISKKFKSDLLRQQIELTFEKMAKKQKKILEDTIEEAKKDGLSHQV